MKTSEIILQQLGGHKFIVMTGAKHIIGSDYGLSFKLPSNFAKDEINFVRITLNYLDLYDMEFIKIDGLKIKPIKSADNIYNDQLKEIFTSYTGLQTKLF